MNRKLILFFQTILYILKRSKVCFIHLNELLLTAIVTIIFVHVIRLLIDPLY